MILRAGNMWDAVPSLRERDLLCITTNAQVRARDGALVMGRGIALEAAQRFPGLQQEAGRRIVAHLAQYAERGYPQRYYGLLILRPGDVPGLDFHLGLFQVKWHWLDQADPRLIARSVRRLHQALGAPPPGVTPRGGLVSPCAGGQAHLNLPGAGNGRLPRDVALGLVQPLPDTVTVWEYG